MQSDSGYALLTVVGFGTALVLAVGAVSGYAISSIHSAGRGQGFHAALQAAQAGVDDFVAKVNDDRLYRPDETRPYPVPGSSDGKNDNCSSVPTPANCPQFQLHVEEIGAAGAGGFVVTSTGLSRGIERTVRVTLKPQAFTDYLYFSEVDAADPTDGFAYPSGAPQNCGLSTWSPTGGPTRPTSGCVVPKWRAGESTLGSRVHTDDAFAATGNPTFGSRVTVANPACATNPAQCVSGGSPTYGEGAPSYADDLDMPATGLAGIASAPGRCTYSGPTRIKFLDGADAGKMHVWSPQTVFATEAERIRCGGHTPGSLSGALNVGVKVTAANRVAVAAALDLSLSVTIPPVGPTIDVCDALVSLTLVPLVNRVCVGTTKTLSLDKVLSSGLLNDLAAALPYTPTAVAIPSAIYVQPAAPASSNLDAARRLQCLLASAAGLGLYSGDLQLALNDNVLQSGNCNAGTLYVSGTIDGRTTAGAVGDIVIMDDLKHAGNDDSLGLVADGAVEVYNPLQCILAIATCLSLDQELTGLRTGLANLTNPQGSALEAVLSLVPGYGDPIEVDAAIIADRFGMQLPLLSPTVGVSLLNGLIAANPPVPKLTVKGSIAQRYRGILGGQLLGATVTLSGGRRIPSFNLASATVNYGYYADYRYDERLRTNAPDFLPPPAPTNPVYEPKSFAELDS